jgi:disease resistance protein RPM1
MRVRVLFLISLTKMPNLGRLLLFASDKNDILDLRTLRPLPNIKLLWLAGKLEGGMLPPMFAKFEKLTQLKMDWSDLKKDPISSFSHMVNLVDLWLFGSYTGEWLTFSTGWFPKLKFLQLADVEHLNHIQIEDGTMMSLQTLGLAGLRNLKFVPEGIKYIRTLHRMFLVDMSNEFTERMRGSENHIVQHIPNIHCFDSSDSQAGNFHSPL